MKAKWSLTATSLLLVAAVSVTVLSACSSNSSGSYGTRETMPAASSAAAHAQVAPAAGTEGTAVADKAGNSGTVQSTTAPASAAAALSNQKIIERLNYQIETLKFDDSASKVQSLCTSLGGYVQDSNVTGNGITSKGTLRQASYTLRIPQEKLAQLKSSAGQIGNILSFNSSSENISDQYYDTEARLKSLRTQQERLLAMMQKSGKLSDMIELEKALADVNYQIEQLTGTLKQYDSLVNYSTVTIQLNEVVEPTVIQKTPATLGERISQQFLNSMRGLGSFGENLAVFFLGCSPILILLLALAFLIYWALLGRKRHAEKKRSRAIPTLNGSKPEQSEESTSTDSDKPNE